MRAKAAFPTAFSSARRARALRRRGVLAGHEQREAGTCRGRWYGVSGHRPSDFRPMLVYPSRRRSRALLVREAPRTPRTSAPRRQAVALRPTARVRLLYPSCAQLRLDVSAYRARSRYMVEAETSNCPRATAMRRRAARDVRLMAASSIQNSRARRGRRPRAPWQLLVDHRLGPGGQYSTRQRASSSGSGAACSRCSSAGHDSNLAPRRRRAPRRPGRPCPGPATPSGCGTCQPVEGPGEAPAPRICLRLAPSEPFLI